MTDTNDADGPPALRVDGPAKAGLRFVLAHGAGQPMDSPFMEAIARGLAGAGFGVVRFEFPYMARRRETGRRGPPDRMPVLCDRWREVFGYLRLRDSGRLVIGGKSMGGRVASMVADELAADGVVCLGYPFHPPGEPDRLRTDHLMTLRTPALICQGTRDSFGSRQEVSEYRLAPAIRIHWLEDGDHGFRPRKSSGRSEAGNIGEAVAAMVAFGHRLSP